MPRGDRARFISDLVDELDLSAIKDGYKEEVRWCPPYHPRMKTKLWVYAYAMGTASSRKQERLARRVSASRCWRPATSPTNGSRWTGYDRDGTGHVPLWRSARCCKRRARKEGILRASTALAGRPLRRPRPMVESR